MDIYKKMEMFLCLFNGPDNTLCIYIYVYRFLLCVSPASPSSQKKRRNFGAGRLKHIIHPSLYWFEMFLQFPSASQVEKKENIQKTLEA